MIEIINFIITNYTWILLIVIIILLAIIGSIADKTGFGSENNEPKKENKQMEIVDLSNKRLDDVISTNDNTSNKQPEVIGNNETLASEQASNIQVNQTGKNFEEKTNKLETVSHSANIMKSLEDKLNTLDGEINASLPKKNIINDNILDDIEGMSFDSDNMFSKKSSDTIGVDDLELPNIKPLKKDNEDVWKI